MKAAVLVIAVIAILAIGVHAQAPSAEVELKKNLNAMCANTTGPAFTTCRDYANLIWQGALFAEEGELAELLVANTQPNGGCSIGTGIQCAAVVSQCVNSCKAGVTACLQCMGPSWNTCCPCIQKVVSKIKCD